MKLNSLLLEDALLKSRIKSSTFNLASGNNHILSDIYSIIAIYSLDGNNNWVFRSGLDSASIFIPNNSSDLRTYVNSNSTDLGSQIKVIYLST